MKSPLHKAALFGVLGTLAVVVVLCPPGTVTWAADEHPAATTMPAAALTPEQALTQLREGNERFVSGNTRHPNTNGSRRTEVSKNGQKPFAIVIGCADSRVPVERLFDRGIGDLFVVRVAGNICDSAEAASVEYAVEHLGAALVVVLGHTQCGAVTAAASGAEVRGPVGKLLEKIKPAVAKAHAAHPGLEGTALVPEAIKANVWQSIEDLFNTSAVACEFVRAGKLKVVGALYSLETGHVQWLGPHPNEKELLAQVPAQPAEPSAVAAAREEPAAPPGGAARARESDE